MHTTDPLRIPNTKGLTMPEFKPFLFDGTAESYLKVQEAMEGVKIILGWEDDINTPREQIRKTLKGSGQIKVYKVSQVKNDNDWRVHVNYPLRYLMRELGHKIYDSAESAKSAVDQYLATLPHVRAVGVQSKGE